jgi:ribosomal protein L40E
VARFRLRFLLQEFDLVAPEVLLGRSPDCQITIEDPLISRHHARIRIAGEDARILDLGSRNGVRLNGRLIDAERPLKDGDRIRLGTQELVFTIVKANAREARPTGFMRVCAQCGTPHPEVARQCPHCGSVELREEDTMSGVTVEPKRSWTFQLFAEVIDRALATGRSIEADRLTRRAVKEVDDRMVAGDRLDPTQIATISAYVLRLAKLQGGSEWIGWAIGLHRRHDLVPSSDVITLLEEVDGASFPDARAIVGGYVEVLRARAASMSAQELSGFARLEKLTR